MSLDLRQTAWRCVLPNELYMKTGTTYSQQMTRISQILFLLICEIRVICCGNHFHLFML